MEGGLIPPGEEDLTVSQERAINSQEGKILPLWVVLTLACCVQAGLPCAAWRVGLVFAVRQDAAVAASLWGGSAGRGGLCCCCSRCVGLGADTVRFPGSAKPVSRLIIQV